MPDCMLPLLFASFSGLEPPLFLPEMAVSSVEMLVPPPTDEKGYIWWPYDYSYDTDNFTVQWIDPTIPASFAEFVGLAAEEAWTQYIDTEGWLIPPTSETYRVTIWLDRSIDYPGLAVMYEDTYMEIVAPVIYMNPDYADEDPAYLASLTHHEVGHTIQFGLRDYSGVEPDAMHTEAWYWEASASWMSERVRPASADAAYLSAYYAEDTTAAFDTVDYSHEYGMYLVNVYLSQFVIGWEGVQDIWVMHDGDDWLTAIERQTEEEAALTWAAFSGTYMSRELEHSAAMFHPTLEEVPRVVEGHLGAQYLEVTSMESRFEGGTIHLDGGVGTILRDGWMFEVFTDQAEIPEGSGDPILIVTNPSPAPLTFSYWLEEPTADTGDPDTDDTDTGADADTGDTDTDTDADTGDTDTDTDADAYADASGSESGKKGCGCSAPGVISPASWLLALVPLWIRRRQTARANERNQHVI